MPARSENSEANKPMMIFSVNSFSPLNKATNARRAAKPYNENAHQKNGLKKVEAIWARFVC